MVGGGNVPHVDLWAGVKARWRCGSEGSSVSVHAAETEKKKTMRTANKCKMQQQGMADVLSEMTSGDA
jgi:hypothetical protein